MTNRIIKHDGDTWRVLSVGSFRDNKVFCHLVSTTRSTERKNGAHPLQITDWIEVETATAGFAHLFKSRGLWRVEVSRTPDPSEGVIDNLGPFASIYDAKAAARDKGYIIHNA